jgi:hypothetical protein
MSWVHLLTAKHANYAPFCDITTFLVLKQVLLLLLLLMRGNKLFIFLLGGNDHRAVFFWDNCIFSELFLSFAHKRKIIKHLVRWTLLGRQLTKFSLFILFGQIKDVNVLRNWILLDQDALVGGSFTTVNRVGRTVIVALVKWLGLRTKSMLIIIPSHNLWLGA